MRTGYSLYDEKHSGQRREKRRVADTAEQKWPEVRLIEADENIKENISSVAYWEISKQGLGLGGHQITSCMRGDADGPLRLRMRWGRD